MATARRQPRKTLPSAPLPAPRDTVESLLEASFRMPPIDSDKELNLRLLLTALNPSPLPPEETLTLLSLLRAPQQLNLFRSLLQRLVEGSRNLPPDQQEQVLMYLPSDPTSIDPLKAYRLRLLLTPLPPSVSVPPELLTLLQLSQMTPAQMDTFKRLLRELIRSLPLEGEVTTLGRDNLPIPLVGADEIRTLSDLKTPEGNPLLSLVDRDLLFNVVGLIMSVRFEEALSFLRRASGLPNPREAILFDSPLLKPARDKYAIDFDILRLKVKVSVGEGLYKCNRCGSKEVSYVEKQIRSADEPMTLFFSCLSCNKKWKE